MAGRDFKCITVSLKKVHFTLDAQTPVCIYVVYFFYCRVNRHCRSKLSNDVFLHSRINRFHWLKYVNSCIHSESHSWDVNQIRMTYDDGVLLYLTKRHLNGNNFWDKFPNCIMFLCRRMKISAIKKTHRVM
jgi:hypothetical protein